MKEMTLQDIQNVSLDILKDVHAFCESHNIKYSLAYGTLIGALRHKGFIPWDDDVDIVIPRPDFERFCQEYKSTNGYELYVPGDPNNFLSFARVCDNKHTYVRTLWPWTTTETGVWIDVFPLDGLPSEENAFLTLVKQIRGVQQKVDRFRVGRYVKLSEAISLKNLLYLIKNRILSIGSDINTLLNQHISLLKSNRFEDSDYYGQLCVMDHPEKEHNPKADFVFFLKMPFCDSEFYVMNGYDNVLKRYYGDYMQLPPEEKRIPIQMTYIKYFWKT